MPIQTTYTQARANLAKLFDEVTENREVVIIRRRRGDDIAVVAADELAGLTETAHLLRSPKNARRLLQALARAQERTEKPQTLKALKGESGLEKKHKRRRKRDAVFARSSWRTLRYWVETWIVAVAVRISTFSRRGIHY